MINEKMEYNDEHQGPGKTKKAYATPYLIVHGNIETITRGGDDGNQDGDGSGTSIGGGI